MTALLSPGHAAQLLDQVIVEEVLACIATGKLNAVQERLAIELGRLGVSDTEMVDLAHELIARALHHIADHGWSAWETEHELRVRYINELCREDRKCA